MRKYSFKWFVYYWLPPILWASIIFSFSASPTGQVSGVKWQDFSFKKFAHVVEYGTLATLIYRGLVNTIADRKRVVIYTIIIAVVYGITDEFHQSFTPGREPHIRDVIFDTIGVILAILAILKLPQYKFFQGFVDKLNPYLEIWEVKK